MSGREMNWRPRSNSHMMRWGWCIFTALKTHHHFVVTWGVAAKRGRLVYGHKWSSGRLTGHRIEGHRSWALSEGGGERTAVTVGGTSGAALVDLGFGYLSLMWFSVGEVEQQKVRD